MPTRILMAFQLSAAVMDVARSGHPQTGIFLLLSGWPQSLVVLDRQSAGGDAGRVEALGKIGVCLLGEIFPHVVADNPFRTARTGTKYRRVKWPVRALDHRDAGRVEALLEVVVYGGGELRPGLR